MKDENFIFMTEVEKDAWISLKSVIKNFIGNNKDPDYINTIENKLQKFKALGCSMSIKIHFYIRHFLKKSWHG